MEQQSLPRKNQIEFSPSLRLRHPSKRMVPILFASSLIEPLGKSKGMKPL